MIDWLIPGAGTMQSNPMYQFETRRQRRKRTLNHLARTTRRWGLLVGFMCMGYWLIQIISGLSQQSTYAYVYYGSLQVYDYGLEAIAIIGLISLASTLPLDFISIVVSVNSLAELRTNHSWPLIQVSPLPPNQILHAKHTITQSHGWRMFVIALMLRVMVLVLFTLQAFLVPASENGETTFSAAIDAFRDVPFETTILIICAALLGLTFIAETFWRFRTVTAIGMQVSTQVGRPAVGIITGVGYVVAMWLSQGFIVVFTFFLLSRLGGDIYVESSAVIAIILLLAVIVFCGGVYAYYRLLRQSLFNIIKRLAFRID